MINAGALFPPLCFPSFGVRLAVLKRLTLLAVAHCTHCVLCLRLALCKYYPRFVAVCALFRILFIR